MAGLLSISDFIGFKAQVREIHNQVKANVPHTAGKNADYIPQLEKVDPSLFAVSVCTIDGQRFDVGHTSENFTAQSCIKPLIYAIALETLGSDKVHKFIGREPSGVSFNSLCLNKNNKPQYDQINDTVIQW